MPRPAVLALPLCLAAALLTACPAPGATVNSPACSVSVHEGRIVSLTNRLTGERMVVGSASRSLAAGLHRLGEQEMAGASWRETAAPGTLEQTAAWRDGSGTGRADMVTNVVAERATGGLVVTQRGAAVQKGLYGVSWALGDVPDGVEVLVPGTSGQRFGLGAPAGRRTFEYPFTWEAGFVLLQAKRGGVLIYAGDPGYTYKNLDVERERHATRLRFESRNVAPFEEKVRIVSSRWWIVPYQGAWTVGAALYRSLVQKPRGMAPFAAKQPAWARDIQFVVTLDTNAALLAPLAAHCDPRRTLLYVPGWRRDGYDRNYPDYTAAPGFGTFVDAAHRLGFRVMPHVNYFGCDPKNPLYSAFAKWQIRDPFTKEPQWWTWDRADPPIKFAYIDPASRAWRKLFVERMVELCRQYKVDALHLDQTLCIYNDYSGPIDGLTCIEGSIALHRELKQALPQVALSGEGLDEVTCLYEQFAQRHLSGLNHAAGTWDDRAIAQAHAVSSAVLLPYARIYGYLGMTNPDNPGLYLAWQRGYEHFGVLPTYMWPNAEGLAKPTAGVSALFDMARFFQRNQPEPDFSAAWAPGDLFVYRLADGRRAGYRRDQGVAFVVRGRNGQETVLSRRIEGLSEAVLPGSVPDWPAYDATRILGLDPRRSYEWSPRPRDLAAPHLSALPPGVRVTRAGIGADLARFALDMGDSEPIRLWETVEGATGGVRPASGAARKFDDGAFLDADTGSGCHPDGEGLFIHPPWKSPGRGVTFVEYAVRLPDRPQVRFESGVRLDDGAVGKSDGVTFRAIAEAGGESVQAEVSNDTAAPRSLTLDLSALRGRAVRLRIEADPGPAGSPAFDWGRVERPQIVSSADASANASANGPVREITVAGLRLAGAPRAAYGTASLTAGPKGASRVRLSLPNTVVLPLRPPAAAVLPCDLTSAPHTSRVLFGDGVERPGYSYFQAIAGAAACDGVTRPALNLHPPQNGRTLADYWLKLPEQAAHLVTAVGIRDGSKSTGVTFAVEVDGRRVFERSLKPGTGWQPVDVDLAPWRGTDVALTLVTDSEGDFSFDWAAWAEPRLLAR